MTAKLSKTARQLLAEFDTAYRGEVIVSFGYAARYSGARSLGLYGTRRLNAAKELVEAGLAVELRRGSETVAHGRGYSSRVTDIVLTKVQP